MPENTRTAASLCSRFCSQLNMFQPKQNSISSRLRASFSTLRSHLFNNIQMRLFNTRFAQTMSVIIPTLLTLLQLKYQATAKTPFTTHPYTMNTAVVTAFGYYLACIAQLTYSSSPRLTGFTHHCMVWFGTVSVASIASVFFYDSMRPLLYFFSVLMSSGEIFHMVNQSGFIEDLGGRVFHRRFVWNLGRISSFGRVPILPRWIRKQYIITNNREKERTWGTLCCVFL